MLYIYFEKFIFLGKPSKKVGMQRIIFVPSDPPFSKVAPIFLKWRFSFKNGKCIPHFLEGEWENSPLFFFF